MQEEAQGYFVNIDRLINATNTLQPGGVADGKYNVFYSSPSQVRQVPLSLLIVLCACMSLGKSVVCASPSDRLTSCSLLIVLCSPHQLQCSMSRQSNMTSDILLRRFFVLLYIALWGIAFCFRALNIIESSFPFPLSLRIAVVQGRTVLRHLLPPAHG